MSFVHWNSNTAVQILSQIYLKYGLEFEGLLLIIFTFNVRMHESKYMLKIVRQYHLQWKMNNVCKLIVAKCDHVTFVWALTVQENADNIFSFSASNKQFYIYRYIAAIKRFHLCFHAIKSDFFCVSSSRHFAILLPFAIIADAKHTLLS